MSDAIGRLFEQAQMVKPDRLNPAVETAKEIRVELLPVDDLIEMDQPFRAYSDAELNLMRQSIIEHGIIQNLIVRPYNGCYQIVAGRNRRRGAKLAGLPVVPCEIRDLTDDEATLLMIETNLRQRQKLLPSERAWAYKQRLETLNRQGQKEFGTCGSDFHKSRDAIGEEDEISGRQVTNYIRLTALIPELLEQVDAKRLLIDGGVSLSYLSTDNQVIVYKYFYEDHHGSLSRDAAAKIRLAGEKKKLSSADLDLLLTHQTKPLRRVKTIPLTKTIKQYFKPTDTQEAIVDRIVRALELLGKEEAK